MITLLRFDRDGICNVYDLGTLVTQIESTSMSSSDSAAEHFTLILHLYFDIYNISSDI